MGLSGVSFWQLLIVFGIVILIFGTSKLKSIGGDLGGAIKGFRKAMETDDESATSSKKDESRKLEADTRPDAEFSETAEKDKQN